MPDQRYRTGSRYRETDCWSDHVFEGSVGNRSLRSPFRIGVLKGEGIGPEVIQAALQVLSAIEAIGPCQFDVCFGGPIGLKAQARHGRPLSGEVTEFCRLIFSSGGAILAGPGGGRFVYDLRKQFDLFCKLSPLRVLDELIDAGRVKPQHTQGVDIILVRDNISGIYQGRWTEMDTPDAGRRAEHSFCYTESEVRRLTKAAARIASHRRGEMTVVIKDGGIPAISDLWRKCATEVAAEAGMNCSLINVDYAAYRLIHHAQELDVLVTPNLFGDILADLGAVLLGSRGLTYSGNFAGSGAAVYQTNHGAAYDLAGTDQANPVGQILSLAMLLRESFDLSDEARLMEAAVAEVYRQGWRTADLREDGCRLVGTRTMGELVAAAVTGLSPHLLAHEASAAAD